MRQMARVCPWLDLKVVVHAGFERLAGHDATHGECDRLGVPERYKDDSVAVGKVVCRGAVDAHSTFAQADQAALALGDVLQSATLEPWPATAPFD